jgi:hypothetical protein
LDTNLKNVQLAELDMPNAAVANRQLNELLRPNGETLEPSDKYEARGPSGSIRIIVDAQRKLTDVDIQRGWGARIPALDSPRPCFAPT